MAPEAGHSVPPLRIRARPTVQAEQVRVRRQEACQDGALVVSFECHLWAGLGLKV